MLISGKTGLMGLIGWPVSHSMSPAMHNAAVGALKLDVVYLPLPVAPGRLEAAVHGLPALGFLGVNVTVPHKQAVIPYLHHIEPAAHAIGAVNTIKISNVPEQSPVLHGHNTDHSGFLADLRQQNIAVAGRDCLVLGAGGSARAMAYALARAGGRVCVYARRPEQAQRLVADLAVHLGHVELKAAAWADLQGAVTFNAPLIVNTTPVGMYPHIDATPWPEHLAFPQNSLVYDLIYNPQETRFMQQARAAECRACNGLGMLLQQGALAFEILTGLKPPLEAMAAALTGEVAV